MTGKNKIIKFVSALLIFSILAPAVLFSAAKQVSAQAGSTAAVSVPVADIPQETAGWLSKALHAIATPSTVTNTGLHIKDFAHFLLRQILMRIAKAVLARITQATINWINSDFHGSPLFLENPESFFKDIAKSEIRNLVDMIGYDTFRFPFGKQTALNVIASYKNQLAINAQYTLSKVINDPALLVRYRNDFNYGGWNGFLINTQYPQNNYLGFQMIIQENLASRLEGTLQAPAQRVQSLLQQGMGFLSPQTCPSNPKYNNGANEFLQPRWSDANYDKTHPFDPNTGASGSLQWSEAKNRAKAEWIKNNTCPGGLVNTTPGTVVANQITDALGSNLRQTELGAALGNSLSAIFDALINNFLNKGLNALASAVNPSPSGDNWSYEGQTLSSSVTYDGPTALDIPQNVSVSIRETTSAPISGGTAPYSIETQPNAAVATARISFSGSSNPTLEVTGVAPGQTTVVVKDSSTPPKTVAVTIATNAIGALVVNPRNISTNVNGSTTAIISGGQKPYFMPTGPDETKAIVAFSDTSLVVMGVAPGQTAIVIKDSSTPPKIIAVPIIISGLEDLIIPQNISMRVGEVSNTPISGGVAPYVIDTQLNTTVATAQISGANLAVTGLTTGQAAIIVKDSSTPPKTAGVQITVEGLPPNTAPN